MSETQKPATTVEQLAADVCRAVMAEMPHQPIALRRPDALWPFTYDATDTCPEPRVDSAGSSTYRGCVMLIPVGTSVVVHAIHPDGEYETAYVRYPPGFSLYQEIPASGCLGGEFRRRVDDAIIAQAHKINVGVPRG